MMDSLNDVARQGRGGDDGQNVCCGGQVKTPRCVAWGFAFVRGVWAARVCRWRCYFEITPSPPMRAGKRWRGYFKITVVGETACGSSAPGGRYFKIRSGGGLRMAGRCVAGYFEITRDMVPGFRRRGPPVAWGEVVANGSCYFKITAGLPAMVGRRLGAGGAVAGYFEITRLAGVCDREGVHDGLPS